MFEDFTIKIKNATKDKAGTEEIKTLRMSILEVAEAVEKFALNYGKRHLSGKRSLERIVFPQARKMRRKCHPKFQKPKGSVKISCCVLF